MTVEETGIAPVPRATVQRVDLAGRAYRSARRKLSAHKRLLKFALVGALGYIIYSGLLFLLYDNQALPFLPEKKKSVDLLVFTYDDSLLLLTTLIGTEASIVAAFAGHSLWTFSDRPRHGSLLRRFIEFQLKALVPTLGILTVVVNGLVVGFGIHHYAALPLGFAASFGWNWLWDNRVIWRGGDIR